MDKAKLFQNGRSQAVRLPQEYRFSGNDVGITKIGDLVVLVPSNNSWDSLLSSIGKVSDDFLIDRMQPPEQYRNDL